MSQIGFKNRSRLHAVATLCILNPIAVIFGFFHAVDSAIAAGTTAFLDWVVEIDDLVKRTSAESWHTLWHGATGKEPRQG
jgi:hypothetical protein